MSSKAGERVTVLLVDYENVQKVDLSRIPENVHVKIFVGNSQKSIPFEQVRQAQDLGSRVEWIKIEGNGSNALDFHIAFYLGKEIVRMPGAEFVILSRDRGFDPLVRHLNNQSLSCRRVNDEQEFAGSRIACAESGFTKVYENLAKIEKRGRPRKRATLTQHVAAIFQKKRAKDEVDALVDTLFDKNLVSESNNVLTYHF